jgi:hypothetical protein
LRFEVLAWDELVDDELVDDELLVTELVAEEVLLLTIVVEVVTAVDVVVVGGGSPPGGSRWNIRASAGPDGAVPTANPFVLERRNRPCKVPLVGKLIGLMSSHTNPSQCRKTGFPVPVLLPTAQPSFVESTKIDVRL